MSIGHDLNVIEFAIGNLEGKVRQLHTELLVTVTPNQHDPKYHQLMQRIDDLRETAERLQRSLKHSAIDCDGLRGLGKILGRGKMSPQDRFRHKQQFQQAPQQHDQRIERLRKRLIGISGELIKGAYGRVLDLGDAEIIRLTSDLAQNTQSFIRQIESLQDLQEQVVIQRDHQQQVATVSAGPSQAEYLMIKNQLGMQTAAPSLADMVSVFWLLSVGMLIALRRRE